MVKIWSQWNVACRHFLYLQIGLWTVLLLVLFPIKTLNFTSAAKCTRGVLDFRHSFLPCTGTRTSIPRLSLFLPRVQTQAPYNCCTEAEFGGSILCAGRSQVFLNIGFPRYYSCLLVLILSPLPSPVFVLRL